MRLLAKQAAVSALLTLATLTTTAQTRTLSGRVVDAESGESIAFANMAENLTGRGTTTNTDGFFSLPAGGTITVSCMGYETKTVTADRDTAIVIRLSRKDVKIGEVVVSATVPEVEMVQMSKNTVPVKLVKAMPSFTGEPDIMKAITFLPGVSAGRDGMSDIFVRGGDRDQNLITLDGMKIYNSSHMFGLVSLFNTDMVKNVDVYKGIFPAQYGGRLASAINVTSRDGDDSTRTYHVSVGMLSSTAFAQGPIIPGKLTFAAAARAGYSDLFNIPAKKSFYSLDFDDEASYNDISNYFTSQSFYDVNARLRWKMSGSASLSLSAIVGSDFQRFGEANCRNLYAPLEKTTGRTAIRNDGVSLTFAKSFDNVFWRTSASLTSYRNETRSKTESQEYHTRLRSSSGFSTVSTLKEYALKTGVEHSSAIGKLHAGAEVSRYVFNPSNSSQWEVRADARRDSTLTATKNVRAVESSLYADEEFRMTEWLSISAGLRATAYHASAAMGEGDTTFLRLEPRASLRLMFSRHMSLKAGFSVTNQFNHCVLNYVDGVQSEAWMAALRPLPPQHAAQSAIGLFYANDDAKINASVEGYYKKMSELQHYRSMKVFKEGGLSQSVGKDLVTGGDGRAYGVEIMLSKDLPRRVSASVAYTWQRSERKFDNLNSGKWFPHSYERRHSLTAVGLWEVNQRWKASATFNFSTGTPITMPTAYVGGDMVSNTGHYIFTDINNRLMPNYHRLDLNVSRTHTGKRGTRMAWTLNIYNAYAHKNPSYARFSSDDKACVVSDYSILPSLSWGIWF